MKKIYWNSFLLLFILAFCNGCGNSADENSGTGSIPIRLIWPGDQKSSTSQNISISPATTCPTCTVLSGQVTASGMATVQFSFSFSKHSASISKVPAGSNRQIGVEAKDGSTVLYYGTASGIYVPDGGASNLVNLIMTATADSWLPTSTGTNVPSARTTVYVVWDGTEMIVWGGEDGSTYYNTGGRYNPVTDSWIPTSIGANVPEARENNLNHRAVWDGTEMIIWGGANGPTGQTVLNTGGRYNPATDSWLPTSVGANVPAARTYFPSVWDGTEMVVWGGLVFPNTVLNTGGRYNPVTDTWRPTSTGTNVPIARCLHTAVWDGTDMIVWGGDNFQVSNITYNSGGRYNPVSDAWRPTSIGANVPSARRLPDAVWDGTEMIVWGGDETNTWNFTNTGGRYNPATDSWLPTSTGTNVPSARQGPLYIWDGTEMIVWGGQDNSDIFLNTGGRYNPATDSWLPTPTGANVPTARLGCIAVWTGSEVIVWGGQDALSNAFKTGGRYFP